MISLLLFMGFSKPTSFLFGFAGDLMLLYLLYGGL